MTVRVTPEMRERIDAKKIDMQKENYIYESPDGGKTIYRSEIYDDVSGVKIDDAEQLLLPFDETRAHPVYTEGFNAAREMLEADKKIIGNLNAKVLELEEIIDKIRDLVK